jgi:acyl-CoA synthetase (AMP-forming)/AMP-acid ligase II
MGNLIRSAAQRFGDQPFLVFPDRRLSFRDVDEQSAELASALLRRGFSKDQRVGLLLPNSPEWVVLFCALSRIGVRVNLLGTLYQPPELSTVIRHSDIDTLFVAPNYRHHDLLGRLEEALKIEQPGDLPCATAPYLRDIWVVGPQAPSWARGTIEQLMQREKAGADAGLLGAVEERVDPSDAALVIFTSGTTGPAKGVIHSHRTAVTASAEIGEDLRQYKVGERFWSSAPFFWLGGLNIGLLAALHCGFEYHVGERSRPSELLAYIEEHRIDYVQVWPWEAAEIRADPAYKTFDGSRMRCGFERNLKDELGNPIERDRGPTLFGMTETFGPHTAVPEGSALPASKRGSSGKAVLGAEHRIVDPVTHEVMAPGAEGELWVRTPALMLGLQKRGRDQTFSPDGFYRTGDRCVIDEDGYVYFRGRVDDLLKVKGANVAAQEVEGVLASHPDVQEAMVLITSGRNGAEELTAVLLGKNETVLNCENIKTWLRSQISSYKVPTNIVQLAHEEITRTVSFKINKPALRKRLEHDHLTQPEAAQS